MREKTRQTIEAIIQECPRHFVPDDILFKLRQKGIRLSRATVYRTLDRFIEEGKVIRHWLDQNSFVYEWVDRPHHDHMVCLRCRKMIEFSLEEIERIQMEICKEHGFVPLTHTMLLFGYCDTCMKERTPP